MIFAMRRQAPKKILRPRERPQDLYVKINNFQDSWSSAFSLPGQPIPTFGIGKPASTKGQQRTPQG